MWDKIRFLLLGILVLILAPIVDRADETMRDGDINEEPEE